MARQIHRTLLPLLALLPLAGCGGDGGSNADTEGTSLRFAADEGFNGDARTIVQSDATATVGDGATEATLNVENERTVRIVVPTDSPSAGQSFTVGGENGARVSFEMPSFSFSKAWSGVAGTVTIVAATSTRLAFRLDNVRIEADHTEWVSGEGTATVNGLLANVTRFAPGGNSGLRFTPEGATSADLSPFERNAIVSYTSISGSSTLDIRDREATGRRTLSVRVPNEVAVGATIDEIQGLVYWKESDAMTSEVFYAVTGSLRVVRRTRDAFEVELIEVRFEPVPTGAIKQNTATGTFVINGTVSKP